MRLVTTLSLALFIGPMLLPAAATAQSPGATRPDLKSAEALIASDKFAEAKTTLNAFLTAHPGDSDAEVLLGVTDTFLNDPVGGAAAFDAGHTVPERYKNVAAKAYVDAAVDALKAKDNTRAIALSAKSLALLPSVNALYVEGTAYGNVQDYAKAIATIEKAKLQATGGKADAATLNAIDASLAASYIFGGQTEKGLALAQNLKRRDPSNTRIDDTLAVYYNQQAAAAMKGGKRDEAVADLEAAAKAIPSRAVPLLDQAANLLASGAGVDWKRVKAEADKALAIDANDARANYSAGIALANSGNPKEALVLLRTAKATAGSDAELNANIDAALKTLGG
jgi:tetratricopeptide (TPR) repeat protein